MICTYTYHPSLFIHTHVLTRQQDYRLHSKRALLLHPSCLLTTLLLYSEIFDKYLTCLKGQTWNEERAKRDFSIHTHTVPSYITTSLSRVYFWPQIATTNKPGSHTLWTSGCCPSEVRGCSLSLGEHKCHYSNTQSHSIHGSQSYLRYTVNLFYVHGKSLAGTRIPRSRTYTEDRRVTELRFKIKQIHFPKTTSSPNPSRDVETRVGARLC